MSKRFGLEIKRARKGAGLTQEQAAEELSVSVRTYAKYEGGEILPGDDMVAAMMQVFNNPCLGYSYVMTRLMPTKSWPSSPSSTKYLPWQAVA